MFILRTKEKIKEAQNAKSNPSEVFHFRSVLGNMRRVYRGRGHPGRNVISIKMHSSSFHFVGIMLLCEVFSCQFATYFWGTLSWDGLWRTAFDSSQITNTLYCKCKYFHKRGPDDQTIVFYRSLQIQNYDKKFMLNFCKRKKRKTSLNFKLHLKTI